MSDGRSLQPKLDTGQLNAGWGVVSGSLLADTPSSLVWRVVRDDGTTAVLKHVKPIRDAADVLRGADYLAWRDGSSAIRLLGRDGARMLIEDAGHRTLAHELAETSDAAATAIAAEVVARLQASAAHPVPTVFKPLREHFAGLFDRARIDVKNRGASLYATAAARADRLLDGTRDVAGLHGDLHHENVLCSSRGWLVIDPVGLAGDVAYDIANLFYNPLDRDHLCADPTRIAQMADTFAHALRDDPRRLLDWAVAYGALSAAWHAEDGNAADETRELAIAAIIDEVRTRDFA